MLIGGSKQYEEYSEVLFRHYCVYIRHHNMRKIISIVAVLFLLTSCSGGGVPSSQRGSDYAPKQYVSVKYRDDPVNIAAPAFEYLNTSKSSFVRGAWYDSGDQYMVINLSGTYYHYCDMPNSTWRTFRGADSFGSTYNRIIKGRYDCRSGYVPDY